jgi:hypothetical protein
MRTNYAQGGLFRNFLIARRALPREGNGFGYLE